MNLNKRQTDHRMNSEARRKNFENDPEEQLENAMMQLEQEKAKYELDLE